MKRLISILLILATLVSLCTVGVSAQSEAITLIACSDFQDEAGNESGKLKVKAILNAMAEEGITAADGFLCCGDYDYEYDDTLGGVTALTQSVSGVVSENMVFTQGNHDAAIGTNGLSESGNNDPAHGEYGVFVINEDDYMWYNSSEATVKRTAQRLIEYLNEKLAQGYDKPVFILSHLALNYNMRTHQDGDGKHANYIFNALNAAGEKGLNIIFLFGHDHSNGWDDYLGGAAVYLEKGDEILVAQNSQTEYKKETLAFTYMNAGYVGYYRNVNGADDTLTMTSFEIDGDSVEIARYSRDGLHNLKSEGKTNSYKGESAYSPNTDVYASPRTLTLTQVSDTTPIPGLIEPAKEPAGTGARFVKVTAAADLTDGGKYLLVHSADPVSLMLPTVVSKSNSSGSVRVGFDLESVFSMGTTDNEYQPPSGWITRSASDEKSTVSGTFGDAVIIGNVESKVWTFTASGSKWLIGDGEKYAKFTSTADTAITATLQSEGTAFTVGGSEDAFTFSGDSFVLNYNARGLINGFAANPAPFYIYEYTGYTVSVDGGSAVKSAQAGSTVTVTATPPEGYTFNGWTVVAGDVTLSDGASATATFTMPAEPVKLKAEYTESTPTPPDPPVWENPYTDVAEGKWYYGAVKYVSENGLMNGTSATAFAPDAGVTRGMLVTVLWRAEGEPAAAEPHGFEDVGAERYYAPAVAWAKENGIVTGVTDTVFAPDNNITREQIAAIFYRYAQYKADEVDARADLSVFEDAQEVSNYAKTPMSWANATGLITGMTATTLAPKGNATRAQIATILMRFIEGNA